MNALVVFATVVFYGIGLITGLGFGQRKGYIRALQDSKRAIDMEIDEHLLEFPKHSAKQVVCRIFNDLFLLEKNRYGL